MSIADIVIISLVAFFAVIGVLKGVQKSALSTCAFLVAFLLAFFLSKVVAEALLGVDGIRKFVIGTEGWSLYTWIYGGVESVNAGSSEFISKNFLQPIMEIIGNYPGYTDVFTVNNGLALYLAFMTFSTLVGIGIFLVARMLLMIVTMIIKSFIPKRKSAVNRLFGFVVGAARGAVWSLAFTLVFSVVAGFSFLGFIGDFQKEYETSVVAKHLNSIAYTVKNKFYLPDEDMYMRLVEQSGLVVVEGDGEDEDDRLVGAKADIYVYLQNLNYTEDVYKIADGKITVDPDAASKRIDTTLFKDTGFSQAVEAIMAYNTAAAESIENGSLDGLENSTLHTYIETIHDGQNSIYDILFMHGTTTDGQPLVATKLANYQTEIDSTKLLSDKDAIETANRTLVSMYDDIISDFAVLGEKYRVIAETFGALTLELPAEAVQINPLTLI